MPLDDGAVKHEAYARKRTEEVLADAQGIHKSTVSMAEKIGVREKLGQLQELQ